MTNNSNSGNNLPVIPAKSAGRCINIACKLLLLLVGLAGILLQIGVFSGKVELRSFRMFTILSNCACVFCLALSIVKPTRFLPLFRGACLLSICVTGLVAAVMMSGMINFTSQMGVSMFLLHVVMPLGFILYCLFLEPKGEWKKYYPFLWLVPPYIYFAYIMISAQFMTGERRFPYPFLDYETLGLGRMALILLAMTAFFLLLGFAFFFADRALARRAHK